MSPISGFGLGVREGLSRRSFFGKAIAGAAAVPGAAWTAGGNAAEKTSPPRSEPLVETLYRTLSEEQREKVAIPWADPLRTRVENHWHILPQRVGEFFTRDQQAMIREIFRNQHSDEYRDQVWEAFLHDNAAKGLTTPDQVFGASSVAFFGAPGHDGFQMVLTARHCTRRCQGSPATGAAFGGPIFYGHAARSFHEDAEHKDNVYWFQARRANEVFAMLDGKQRELSLRETGRAERGRKTVELKGSAEKLEGIRVGDLAADQKDHVRKVLKDLLMPFRKEDREETMRLLEPLFDDLRLAFFRKGDIGNDQIWDNWQIEGPNVVWYFRGAPHVHVWVNIEAPPAAAEPLG